MYAKRSRLIIATAVTWIATTGISRAQMAVIDVSSFVQLVQQVQTTQQILANARNQLVQAQQALQTMTGNRGMQLLLNGIARNYLPTGWDQLAGGQQSLGAGYPALASAVNSLVTTNAVLSAPAMASLSAADQQRIGASRYLAAVNQAIARNALSNASARFAGLQTLIGTIGSATDQKGILDLQARISAEQGMLQNEQIKLQSLYQALQAQDAAARQQLQEQVVAGHGQFTSRFQPVP